MKTLKWVNTAAFLAMITVNALANLIPIGGKTTGQISDAYPNLFTPAGISFSIWGIIYVLTGVFILYQWGVFGNAAAGDRLVKNIGALFAISCAANILWILCWHSSAFGPSVLCIAALLASLAAIQQLAGESPPTDFAGTASVIGFGIYFGWIIAATIANVSVWLAASGWDRLGLPETFWTVAVIVIGAAIGALTVTVGRNRAAGAAIIWAYAGILIKHISAAGYAGKYPSVIAAAVTGIVCVLTAAAIAVAYKALDRWAEKT